MKDTTFNDQLNFMSEDLAKFRSSATTSRDKARVAEVDYLIANWERLGDGVLGIVREIMCKRHNSRSTTKSPAGRCDISVGWNNKLGWKTAEVKSNRGTIDYLFEQESKNTLSNNYTVYSVCAEKYRNATQVAKGKAPEYMVLKPIIIRNDLFLQVVRECNALKRTRDTYQLQISVKLYKRLQDYPIPFEMESTYRPEDFEGLEI